MLNCPSHADLRVPVVPTFPRVFWPALIGLAAGDAFGTVARDAERSQRG
jgi:hypothetical protein